jgi:hypothetical protein
MITITIKTDNAAFQDNRHAEVARILRDLANRLDRGFTFDRVQDVNGNAVGSVTLTGQARRL